MLLWCGERNVGHRRRHGGGVIGVWRVPDQRRLLLHVDFRHHVVHGWFLVGLHHAAVIKGGGLVGELVGRKRLGVLLGLHGEGADVWKMVRSQGMRVEGVVEGAGGSIVAGVQGPLGRGEG